MSRISADQAEASRVETSLPAKAAHNEPSAQTALRAHSAARRSLLALGGVAGVGLAAVFTASPAQAKAGDPLKAGLTADAGTSGTGLKTKSTKAGLTITQSGSGTALQAKGEGLGHGVLASVTARSKNAVRAEQNSTSTDPSGYGAAVLALGQKNVGVRASTSSTVRSVPAVVATGAGGLGIALLATGSALMDGDVLALRSLVGVLDSGGELAYAHASSGDHATHTRHGATTLGADGRATVALGVKFTKTVEMGTLVVQLTPQGAAMSGLYCVPNATGFEIRGGAASGKVAWVAFADRLVLTLRKASGTSAGKGKQLGTGDPAGLDVVATGGSLTGSAGVSSTLARRGASRPELSGVID